MTRHISPLPGPLVDMLLKLTFLLNLLSGQRCQTIKFLNTDNMDLTTDKCIFHVTDKVKQTRIGTHIPPLSFVAYPKDKKLCIISNLQRTTPFRKDSKQLLLSHVKPHGPVRKDTISRWCKSVLSSASSTHLADNDINIKYIMLSAGWSNERTFQQFYHKPSDPEFNFGQEILRTLAQN